MMFTRAFSLRRFLRRGRLHASAILAFGLLAFGGTAHLIHHMVDPDCDGPAPASHVCSSCGSLHAGAMVERIQTVHAERPEWTHIDAPRHAAPPICLAQNTGVPRAPPSA